ncbi:DUF4337 domain-containing protein [Alsobacter sp. SYSU BS001988]
MSEHAGVESAHGNKRVALLIAVLALFLALAETAAKSAQTEALAANVEASNLWAFFQAKTIRQTGVRLASELVALQKTAPESEEAAKAKAQLESWKATIDRWETEPSTQEGRRELSTRAKAAEHKRDTSQARYHHYEVASAAFQIAIVIASAMVITGIGALLWLSGALGVAGLAFAAIGLFAPHAVHVF